MSRPRVGGKFLMTLKVTRNCRNPCPDHLPREKNFDCCGSYSMFESYIVSLGVSYVLNKVVEEDSFDFFVSGPVSGEKRTLFLFFRCPILFWNKQFHSAIMMRNSSY